MTLLTCSGSDLLSGVIAGALVFIPRDQVAGLAPLLLVLGLRDALLLVLAPGAGLGHRAVLAIVEIAAVEALGAVTPAFPAFVVLLAEGQAVAADARGSVASADAADVDLLAGAQDSVAPWRKRRGV